MIPAEVERIARLLWEASFNGSTAPRPLLPGGVLPDVYFAMARAAVADRAAVLRDYGHHTVQCDINPCTCGLAQKLAP